MGKGWLLGSVGRLLFGSSRVVLVVWTRICPAGLSVLAEIIVQVSRNLHTSPSSGTAVASPSHVGTQVRSAVCFWRFDPCELVEGGGKLAPLGQGRRAPREPLVDECVTDDEFYE